MLRIHTVREFRVEVDGVERTPASFDRATALLAWLALNPGLHPRGAIAARFWPDVLDESARASLRSALWSLRRELGGSNGSLVSTRERLGLADDVWVDVLEAERLRQHGRPGEALELLDGELLPGLLDDWAFEARDEHRARNAALLEELASAAEAAGDTRRSVELSRRAAVLDPLSEEAHRALMRRLAAAGDRAGALMVFAELRSRLATTLRAAPAEHTRVLAESLRSQAPTETVPPLLRRVDTALFVGRTAELERMRRLHSAGGTTAAVGLLAGEAGSGKTRLAARFAVDAAASGATVLYGCCAEQALVPYEPLADAVRAAGELDIDAQTIEERIAATAGARVVLVLDDLQWADRGTLSLLGRIVRGPVSERLTLVGAYRDDEAEAHLYGALADLRRTCLVERIELGGLDPADVAALIGSAFETSAAAAQARAIHARTGGNPFYARELARHVAERPGSGFLDVPEGIRDVVRARVERLSTSTADVVSHAAVLGEEFDLTTLVDITGRDDDELISALSEAEVAGLVDETDAGRYAFAHALTRDAVYAGLGASRRARLHREAARVLEERCGDGPGRRLAEIALHRCAGAADGSDAGPAVELAARAATLALEDGAYEQAVSLLTRALAILPDTEVERRRLLTRQRAVAFSRLWHVLADY